MDSGGGGPFEGLGVIILRVEVVLDRGDVRGTSAPQPRRRGRGEVQVEPLVPGQPPLDVVMVGE